MAAPSRVDGSSVSWRELAETTGLNTTSSRSETLSVDDRMQRVFESNMSPGPMIMESSTVQAEEIASENDRQIDFFNEYVLEILKGTQLPEILRQMSGTPSRDELQKRIVSTLDSEHSQMLFRHFLFTLYGDFPHLGPRPLPLFHESMDDSFLLLKGIFDSGLRFNEDSQFKIATNFFLPAVEWTFSLEEKYLTGMFTMAKYMMTRFPFSTRHCDGLLVYAVRTGNDELVRVALQTFSGKLSREGCEEAFGRGISLDLLPETTQSTTALVRQYYEDPKTHFADSEGSLFTLDLHA